MVEAATYVNEDRIQITNVTNLPISEELAGLFDIYPDIDEVEFEALTTYVMEFYLQSYEAGNPMDMEGEKLRYLSRRFILVGTKLGCAADHILNIINENMTVIKEFRVLYKPFERDYEVKYETPVTAATINIFSNPGTPQDKIEEFLVKGMHKLKWTGKDKFNKPVVLKSELKISFLRKVMRAVKQVMLFNGMDPTILSVFYDLIELEKKMIHRRKKKQRLSVAEVFFRKETLDNYLKRQLWHLGLVVLKHRKVAKAWHIRFELIKKLSAVERFVLNSKSKRVKEIDAI